VHEVIDEVHEATVLLLLLFFKFLWAQIGRAQNGTQKVLGQASTGAKETGKIIKI